MASVNLPLPVGTYSYALISGATASGGYIINVSSGTTALHTISVIATQPTAGLVRIFDATSGNAGTLVTQIGSGVAPVTWVLDALLQSGLQIVVISGASSQGVVTYNAL